jgi:two-component system phosphate regulon sensor histidine kinase PhoR
MSAENSQKPELKKTAFKPAQNPIKSFVDRVLEVNLPAGVVLGGLVFVGALEPAVAVMSFGSVVLLTLIVMLRYMTNLQSLSDYAKFLAKSPVRSDEELPEFEIPKDMHEETAQIVDSINKMRNIWSSEKQTLKAQTLSDAAVLDSLPDPIIMIASDGKITGANLAARDLLGHNIRERNIRRVVVADEFNVSVENVLNKAASLEEVIFKLPYPWKKTLKAKIEMLPWQSKGGAVAVISLYDVTKLVQVEKVQADFVANASHELRTPLSVISGFIETIQGPAKDDEEAKDKFLGIMSEQVKRMSKLVENLLSLSRIEMDKNVNIEFVDIGDVIDGVVEGLQYKASKKSMKIVFEEKSKTPKDFLADEGQLQQVFQNLVDNAIKYGKSQSDVFVSSEFVEKTDKEETGFEMENAMRICVQNFGKVIPPELIPRLTERFYRLDIHQEDKIVGTGLGMSIVKHAVEKHSGRLHISSDENLGTSFCVYLPIKKEQKEAKTQKLDSSALCAPPKKSL